MIIHQLAMAMKDGLLPRISPTGRANPCAGVRGSDKAVVIQLMIFIDKYADAC